MELCSFLSQNSGGTVYPILLLQADEYVVYSAHQQRMRYLVEFSLPDEESVAVEEARETGEGGVGGDIQVAEEDMEPEPSEGERDMGACEEMCDIVLE